MPELVYGIPLPLFDRLASQLSVEEECVLLDSISGIQSSIRRDLDVLLNTRTTKGYEDFLTENLSVLDFGIPEVGVLGTRSGADLELLKKVIAKSINFFEPRLSNLKVNILPSSQKSNDLNIQIDAQVWIHAEQRKVDFQLALSEIGDFVVGA